MYFKKGNYSHNMRRGDIKGTSPKWVDTCQYHINHTLAASSTISKGRHLSTTSVTGGPTTSITSTITHSHPPLHHLRLHLAPPGHHSPAIPGPSPQNAVFVELCWFKPLSLFTPNRHVKLGPTDHHRYHHDHFIQTSTVCPISTTSHYLP